MSNLTSLKIWLTINMYENMVTFVVDIFHEQVSVSNGRVIFNTLFGFSSNFWVAVISRFLLGICNGILGTVRVCSEIMMLSTFIHISIFKFSIVYYLRFSYQCFVDFKNIWACMAYLIGVTEWVTSRVLQAYASELCSKEHQALGISTVALTTISSYCFLFFVFDFHSFWIVSFI